MTELPQICLTQGDMDGLFALGYPGNADIDAGRISIAVPIGTALLGLRVGQSIDWELPSGERHRYRIVKVPFQPEASGAPG